MVARGNYRLSYIAATYLKLLSLPRLAPTSLVAECDRRSRSRCRRRRRPCHRLRKTWIGGEPWASMIIQMRMGELSARRLCRQGAERGDKKGRWVHQHANGPSSWRRNARALAQRSRGCSREIAVSASILRRSAAQRLRRRCHDLAGLEAEKRARLFRSIQS
jgi:hypothetical protein